MPNWEYICEALPLQPTDKSPDQGTEQLGKATEWLNTYGDGGWELSFLVPTTVIGVTWHVAIFKKQKP